MAEKTAEGLVVHARAQLGFPYIYAFWGNSLTLDYIKWSQRTYHAVWSSGGRLAERDARARRQIGKYKRAYDCAGLVKSYWMQENPTATAKYIQAKDKSAHELYQCCKTNGKIGSLPKNTPGVLVFIWDKGRGCMRHVGIYDGKGRVIEAQGFSTGVVERVLSAGSWTHWGLLDWLEYPSVPAKEKPATAPPAGALDVGDRVRVKPGSKEWYPGTKMPSWVLGQEFAVMQVLYRGMAMKKGGKACVLLDRVNTWCAESNLEKVKV